MDPHDPFRQRERQVAIILGIVCVPAVLALALYVFSPRGRRTTATQPSLVMVQSNTEKGAPAVTGAPPVDATQIDQRLLQASATTGGDLEVSLAWNSLTDLDLQVRDPSGELITAEHRRSASGGVQDVDANPTLLNEEGQQRHEAGQPVGPENIQEVPEFLIDLDEKFNLPEGFPGLSDSRPADRAPSKFTRKPVEHIYFAQAPRGTYTVNAVCFSWREQNWTPLPFTIQVRSRGQVFHQASGVLGPNSVVLNLAPPLQVCQFQIQ